MKKVNELFNQYDNEIFSGIAIIAFVATVLPLFVN